MAHIVVEDTKKDLLTYLDSSEFQSAASNATRLRVKLADSVEKQELYNSHQLLRTLYFRFINHRDKLKPLIDLLYRGARFLLAQNEPISAQDIATILLETSAKLLQSRLNEATSIAAKDALKDKLINPDPIYHQANKTLDYDLCNKIAQLCNELPHTDTGRSKLIAETFKLLHPKLLNRELLHTILAQTYMSHFDYIEARYHFLHCANARLADEIGDLLSDYHHSFGNKSEVDLFLAQFVLQFLCLQTPSDPPSTNNPGSLTGSAGNKKSRTTIKQTVELIVSRYRKKHCELEDEPSPSLNYPLFNFLDFIISILDETKPELQVFKTLCDIYKKMWERDPNYLGYLNRIGVLYFGMIDHNKQQQQQQQGGFFNNILMSLLDGSNDENEIASESRNDAFVSNDDLD